ncbi:hypothetical protein [Candidatus Cyanaurora vandensis]|uniref:hypothetical protein n=1 Tax=Candidatus Cyanaurora vandensis TaxID=2714958 RepID=UPI00257A7012|nr:hypothetical protein [Candidatus Cyanaurora vandensis]
MTEKIVVFLDQVKLTASLALLREQVAQHPNRFTPTYVRREWARRVVAALGIKRRWHGPAPCEDCQYYFGRQGINCALYPNGPTGAACLDWDGLRTGGYYCIEGQGWVYQEYTTQGWTILRTGIPTTEVGSYDLLEEFPWPAPRSYLDH